MYGCMMAIQLPARAGPSPCTAAACSGAPAARVIDSFMSEPPMSLAPQASSRAARSGPIFTQEACAQAGRAACRGAGPVAHGSWARRQSSQGTRPQYHSCSFLELSVGALWLSSDQPTAVARHAPYALDWACIIVQCWRLTLIYHRPPAGAACQQGTLQGARPAPRRRAWMLRMLGSARRATACMSTHSRNVGPRRARPAARAPKSALLSAVVPQSSRASTGARP